MILCYQVTQLCRLLDTLLTKDYSGTPSNLENYFLFALYWSLGAGLTEESRVRFDAFVKRTACFMEAAEGPPASTGPSCN